MGQRAAGGIKRCAQLLVLRRNSSVQQLGLRRLPGYRRLKLQHFRAFPAAVGVTRAPGWRATAVTTTARKVTR